MPLVIEQVQRGMVPPLDAMLEQAQIVRIQNVAQWYWGHDQDYWELHRHFPNVAPPWPVAWYEYHMPRVVQLLTGPARATPLGVGVLINAIEDPAAWWDAEHWLPSALKTLMMMTAYQRTDDAHQAIDIAERVFQDDTATLRACPSDWTRDMRAALTALPAYWRRVQARWVLQLITYVEDPGFRVPMPYYVDFIPVRADGTIPYEEQPEGPAEPPRLLRLLVCATPASVDLFNRPAPYFHPALLANCFAHCKNVAVTDGAPPPKLARRNAQKGRPFLTWKVLDIDPMMRVLRREGGMGEHGERAAAAMHIVRGHFNTYDEKPLFGKWRGTWFVPMHTRGSPRAGLAAKDYAVKGK
jgi:hypothetical protein